MSDLWDRWRAHHKARGLNPEHLCEDGAVMPQLYEQAHPRVVFTLKETNDYSSGLQALLADGPIFQMWHTIARWAAGLLNDFPDYGRIDNPTVMKASLNRVAIVNLKRGFRVWCGSIHWPLLTPAG